MYKALAYLTYPFSKDFKYRKSAYTLLALFGIVLLFFVFQQSSTNGKIQQVKTDYKKQNSFSADSSQWKDQVKKQQDAADQAAKLQSEQTTPNQNQDAINKAQFTAQQIQNAANPDMTEESPGNYIMGILNSLSKDDETQDDTNKIKNGIFLTGGQTQWVFENYLAPSFNVTGDTQKVGYDPYTGTLYMGFTLPDRIRKAFEKRANDIYSMSELMPRQTTLSFKYGITQSNSSISQ